MYSTRKNITQVKPALRDNPVLGFQLYVPAGPDLALECGLRKQDQFKASRDGLPLVSVITVVLNGAETLPGCVRSVLDQSYDNIEYLVIDGGSTDGTQSIIEKNAEAIDYAVSIPDSGIYEAMNRGLGLASGDYILFLNADDRYREDAVAQLVSAARQSGAGIAHADALFIETDGRRSYRVDGWIHDGIFTRGASLRHETMLVPADVYIEHGGYDNSYRILADYEFMMRIYAAGCTFTHVAEPLLYFSKSGISHSQVELRESERGRLFKHLFPFLDVEDLDLLRISGRLTVAQRQRMLDKHRGKSERFARSMTSNIADARREAETVRNENVSIFSGLKRKLARWTNSSS